MSNIYETALEILKKIDEKGFKSYIVGGYSRDKYLGKNSDDIDICTSAKYLELLRIFPAIKDNTYCSYTLNYKGYDFQITTFRRDINYINSRFPKKVLYTKNLKTDLKRRDFIINTLCIDKNGEYIDIFGAKNLIDKKLISLVGRENKIKEDSLRILRAIRFATILNFQIDEKLGNAINKYKENLTQLSFDRKKQELEKILTSKNVSYGIQLLKKYNLDKYLHINIDDVAISDRLGIWAQILIDDSYNFSKEEKKKITTIKKLINIPFELYDLYKYGPDIFKIVSEIKNDKIDITKTYNELPIKDRDDIDITFFDICDVVLVDNQMINTIYKDLEKKIIYKELPNKKKNILKYIKENY